MSWSGIRKGESEPAADAACASLQPISLLDQDIASDPNYSTKYDAWIGCLRDAGTKLTTSAAEKATGSFTLADGKELGTAPIDPCEQKAFGFVG